jgi:hypothetical protein
MKKQLPTHLMNEMILCDTESVDDSRQTMHALKQWLEERQRVNVLPEPTSQILLMTEALLSTDHLQLQLNVNVEN